MFNFNQFYCCVLVIACPWICAKTEQTSDTFSNGAVSGSNIYSTLATAIAAETTTPLQNNQAGGGTVKNVPVCNKPANLTGLDLPQWYVEFWRAKEATLCKMPYFNWTDDYTKAIAIDKTTGAEVPWTTQCDLNWNYAKYQFLGDYYHSFLRITPFPGKNSGGAPEGSPEKITMLLNLFCAPIAIFAFMCGVYVIRKILKDSDGHLFVYHAVLIFADVCSYILDTTHVTYIAQFLLTPLCYTSLYLASAPFTNHVPNTWIAHESAAFGLSNLVQALLATDRAVALCAPLWYRAHAGLKMALGFIGGLVCINSLVWLGQIAVTGPWEQFLIQATSLSTRHKRVEPITALFGSIRALMFVVSWFAQCVGCGIVFAKVLQAKRNRARGRKNNADDISLVPCYLLVGTCVMNLSGCTTMCLFLLPYYVFTSHTLGSLVGSINSWQLIFIPILNNLGFYVHCLVCQQYRDAVREIVVKTFRRLCCWRKCKKFVPGRKREKGEASVSADTTLTVNKISQVAPHPHEQGEY